ncbi:MAG: glycosyltransferase family 2 protein, partial [Candidatus Methylomirabilis sp.]
MNRPDVSIIIVSWNTSAHLARCLAAIPKAAEHLVIEVIVVDNGSTDGTQAMLADKFPHVRVIQNPENLGFGRAHNIGARASRGRTLLLLNSDCELGSGSLPAMVGALDEGPALGVVFCRLLNTDGTLQPSVHPSCPSPWSTIGDLLFLSSLRYALYRSRVLSRWLLWPTIRAHRKAQDVAWGGGACLLIRRTVFEAVGGFDEQFFLYYEDVDLCKRIREAGYRLRFLPGPSAVHHWGKSTAQLPAVMLWEVYRSRLYYFRKHFPDWGGSIARWMALRDLEIRSLVFSFLALVPSHRRPSYRDQAAASSACLQFVRDSPSHESKSPSRAAAGIGPWFLALVVLFSLFHYLHDLAKLLI